MPFVSSMLSSLNCASSRSSKLQRRTSNLTKKRSNQSLAILGQPTSESNLATNSSPSAPPPYQPTQQLQLQLPDLTTTLTKGRGRLDSTPSGESFWDLGNFKYVLKRCDNGNKLSTELTEMITERAKLEEAYAKSLKQWAKKWSEHLSNESSEYGTTKDAWYGFLEAGTKTAEIHSDTCKTLINQPVFKIKEWQKKKFEKHYINFKQTKEFEQDFELAEKSWLELNEKLKRCKRDYYDAHKAVKVCEEAARAAAVSPKVSQEQREKYDEKTKRAREEVERTQKRYKDTLIEMDIYKPQHMRKMLDVFAKTQNFEQERMLFVKQTFAECYDVLSRMYQDERFDELFEAYLKVINEMDAKRDVEWWELEFGPGTQANWPTYEEYQEKN